MVLISTANRAAASLLHLSDAHSRVLPLSRWLRLYTQMQTLLARKLWLPLYSLPAALLYV